MSAVISLLVAIGGATYALVTHGSLGASDRASGGPSGAAGHSTAATDRHAGDLRRYLLASPGGSQPWPHPLGTDGTLSLHQVADLGSNSQIRTTTLVSDHFTHGAVQCWITGTGIWVDVRLYQFRSAADAQAFFHTDISASAQTTPAADQSGVSGVPGARVFAAAKPDKDGYVSVLGIGVKGDVTFLVDIAEHSAKAQRALPDSLMQAEYGKL